MPGCSLLSMNQPYSRCEPKWTLEQYGLNAALMVNATVIGDKIARTQFLCMIPVPDKRSASLLKR
eukprot:4506198-Amphidinium_carterae.1